MIVSWGQILTTVKMMNQIGVAKLTAAKLTAAIRGFKGPQALGAPSLQCGKYKTEPAACNDQTQFFQYQGKGVFKRLTGWLRPPANFTPRARTRSRTRGGAERRAPPLLVLTLGHGLEPTPPLRDPRPRRRSR